MLGGDQRAVPGAAAAEHDQAEHGFQDSRVISFCANGNSANDEGYRKIFEAERLFLSVSIHSGFGSAFFLAS
jgi:hypothetical protein